MRLMIPKTAPEHSPNQSGKPDEHLGSHRCRLPIGKEGKYHNICSK